MNVSIEEVSDKTQRIWVRLMHELWHEHTMQVIKAEAKAIVQSNHQTAFLVNYDHKYLGFINVSIRRDHVPGAAHAPVGYIEGIFVKPKWRHRGMAKQLVQHATHWFLINGCKEVASDSEIENLVSQGWHEAMGFSKVSVLVHYSKKINR